jgi:hypothetical protein
VKDELELAGHEVLDPMRGTGLKDISPDGLQILNPTIPIALSVGRDLMDIGHADVLLVVFWGGLDRQSIGTWMECGIAAWLRKPLVVCTDDLSVAQHPFILQLAAIVVPTVEEAIAAVKWIGKGHVGHGR